MGLKSELKRFSNEHPLLSIMYIGFLGFTAIDLASSFTSLVGKVRSQDSVLTSRTT